VSFSNQNFSRLPEYFNKEKSEYNKISMTSTVNDNTNENNFTNENDNSDIVYQKMNVFNRKDIEIDEEVVDTNGVPESPKFTNTDRDFVNKYVVETDIEIIDEYNSDNFAFVKCKNITTIKINEETFSFLTNPINDENFFFIKLNKNKPNQYELVSESEYIEECLIYNKSEYSKLKKLTEELNDLLKPVRSKIAQEERKRNFKDLLILVGFVLFYCIFMSLFFIFFEFFTGNTKSIVIIVISLIGLIILGNLVYKYYYSERYLMNSVYTLLFKHQIEVEKLINKWNKEYFNNLEISASVPFGYQYIQFDLKPNFKLHLLHHEIYGMD
jgi:hypothetical protein